MSQQHQDDHLAFSVNFMNNAQKEQSDLYNWAEYVWDNVGNCGPAHES